MEPVKLQEWTSNNIPDENLHYSENWWVQTSFVCDSLAILLLSTLQERRNQMTVVAEHKLDSITLPVYRISLPGITLTLSSDFYKWIISIDSEQGIHFDFSGLTETDSTVNPARCPGFEPEWVFGSYAKSKMQFTVYLSNNYQVYTFLFLLKKCILMKQV